MGVNQDLVEFWWRRRLFGFPWEFLDNFLNTFGRKYLKSCYTTMAAILKSWSLKEYITFSIQILNGHFLYIAKWWCVNDTIHLHYLIYDLSGRRKEHSAFQAQSCNSALCQFHRFLALILCQSRYAIAVQAHNELSRSSERAPDEQLNLIKSTFNTF